LIGDEEKWRQKRTFGELKGRSSGDVKGSGGSRVRHG